MLTVRAPAATSALEIFLRNSGSVRAPSSAENSTSSTCVRASSTAATASSSTCCSLFLSLYLRWIGLVAMKVWMRGRLACSRLLAARSTSSVQQRASAATCAHGNSRLTASTAWKSPSLAMGKPASRISTPSSTSFRAIFSFSCTVMLQPGDCSPSRRVVSKMYTRLLTRALSRSRVRFSKFIILAVHISKCYIQRTSHGTQFPASISHRRDREELFPRGGQIIAHAAGHLALLAAAGAGTGGETDRPVGQGPDSDRRRPNGAGVRAALPEPAPGDGQLDRRAARQFRRAADHRRQRIDHLISAEAHRALPRDVPEGEGADPAQLFEQAAQRASGRQSGTRRDQLRPGR